MTTQARQRFFDKQVHMEAWKQTMSGKNEDFAIKVLHDLLGYEVGVDYVRQHPIGERFVIDFAFVNERVAIEIDGKSHSSPLQKKIDSMRDKFLLENGWVPIRIRDYELRDTSKKRFWKNMIRAVVDERREQYKFGTLISIEEKNFKQEDYE